MEEINNPHDKFFKRLFGHLATMADFIRNYLPPELVTSLDLDSLTLEKESFIDPKLRDHFSDLLFRVRLAAGGELYLYLLLEHKSAPDPWVAFQLLRYIVRFWERLYDQGCAKLPWVMPIVFYHGEERWRVSQQFSGVLEKLPQNLDGAVLQKYVFDFAYDLQDFSARKGGEIKGQARLRTGLTTLRHIFSKDLTRRLPDIFRSLRELKRAEALEYMETLLTYLLAAGKKVKEEEIVKAMAEVIPPISPEEAAHPFVQFGMQLARKLFEERAETLGMVTLMLRQAQHRFGALDKATQEQICALPRPLLEEFGEALLDFTSLADLQKWLAEHSEAPKIS
jgi:predicted transposase/invertase (TIGR01784 family)